MTARKTPILLRRAPVSGRVMALYRYSTKGKMIVCGDSGRQDVTADFEELMLSYLMDDGAADIVGILDGVADGQLLTLEERAQVRVVRERIREACERHNERNAA
jgi:hypothetical protein